MLRGTGFADLIGSGEYVDYPSEDYQEDEEDEDLAQGEAEFMEFEEVLETKPDLGPLIGDELCEQEGK